MGEGGWTKCNKDYVHLNMVIKGGRTKLEKEYMYLIKRYAALCKQCGLPKERV